MTDSARKLVEVLRLPFESMKTLYNGTAEVRLYRNEITGVLTVGKRVSWAGLSERAIVVREAELLERIRHDNIVPVHDVAVVHEPGIDPAVKIIEMIIPYYATGSVYDSLVRGERYSVGNAVRLVREALAGLGELHETHRFIHRDIKSANVFIDDRNRARIGDLGQVIPMESDDTAEAFVGNQMYTPPEVLLSGRCDRRTDIYGIGLMLFELVNGPFPYASYTPAQIADRLQKGRRPIRDADLQFKPFVPPRVRTIVSKAISRNVSQRYATARSMVDAINAAPLIDWQAVDKSDRGELCWEGACTADRSSQYQIRAIPKKGGRWLLTGCRRVSQWRRIVDDQIVTDPAGTEARLFFDNMLKAATSR